MTPVDIFFAASTAGGYVLPLAALFAAIWAGAWACRWACRLTAAAVQWRRDTSEHDPAPDLVFDQLDRDLTEYAYKIHSLYVKEGDQ